MVEEKKIDPYWPDIPKFEAEPMEEYEGQKTSIDNVLNKEIAILKFRVMPSSFFEGDYCLIQIMDPENNLGWFTTGSKVLIAQLNELKEAGKLPIRCKIVKIKRYYSITKPDEKK